MTAKTKPAFVPSALIPGLIILVGVLLTLWMQTFVRNGVVFSGDGGLKALLAQQLAQQLQTGSFPLEMALKIPAPDWAISLWQQGLYPFQPPFVYEVGSQYFITFPFTFPLVSAPFYALFGDRGLYVVPLVALWSIWFRFWQLSRRAKWGLLPLSIGLVSLIFASPLSLYGGMYWEHTLAVALAFWGVSALMFPRDALFPQDALISRNRALGSGILIGLSVWFRPEFLCLIVAVSLLAIVGWLLPRWNLAPPFTLMKAAILIGAMGCTVGVFFALNYGIYGHPLGIHAIQIVEESNLATQVAQAKDSYGQMFSSLIRYFPVAVLVAIAAAISPEFKQANLKTTNRFRGFKTANTELVGIRHERQREDTVGRFALALSILFALSVPLIVPPGAGGKQWGPRFYLILVPLLSLVLAEQLRSGFLRTTTRRVVLVGAAIALVLGIQLNTFNGAFASFKADQSVSLKSNYEPIAPAIAQLQQQPLPWIAISHEFVAQQLWLALPDKTFFRTETIAEVKQLAAALVAQGEGEFLYVCYPHRDCPTPETPENGRILELAGESNRRLKFAPLGDYGKYPIYKVEIAS
ncbi:MAG: hypothetical protein WA885_25410 [Phormidesmis sp.]